MEKMVFFGAANPETIRIANAIRRDRDFEVVGFLDNDPNKWGTMFLDFPVFGGIDQVARLAADGATFVNLITGNLVARCAVSREIVARGGILRNFIHPGVSLEMVGLGTGIYIQEGVLLQAGVSIGDNSSIHMGSLIGHESSIGSSAFIAHGVSVSGCCSIGDGCFIGTHATVLPRLSIGAWSVVGAGAIVTRDVPANSVVVGNPARVIRHNDSPYADGSVR